MIFVTFRQPGNLKVTKKEYIIELIKLKLWKVKKSYAPLTGH